MQPESTDKLRWFAVHTRSRHEFRVLERLTGTGVEAFLPSVKRISRWKDRKKVIESPLFPGYIFIHTDNNPAERMSVLKTPGVVRFLGIIPGEPEPVPEEQIAALRRLIESGAPLDPYPYLKEGRRIRIVRGPLAGVEGILVQKVGDNRLVLSIDLLQQSASATIDPADVEPV